MKTQPINKTEAKHRNCNSSFIVNVELVKNNKTYRHIRFITTTNRLEKTMEFCKTQGGNFKNTSHKLLSELPNNYDALIQESIITDEIYKIKTYYYEPFQDFSTVALNYLCCLDKVLTLIEEHPMIPVYYLTSVFIYVDVDDENNTKVLRPDYDSVVTLKEFFRKNKFQN